MRTPNLRSNSKDPKTTASLLVLLSLYSPLSTNPQKQFKVEIVLDESAYEAERLSRDAEARQSMAEASERESKEDGDPKAWKWVIRKRVWDLMEALNIAQFPRPVHHRIPNFVGASLAANKVVKGHLR